MLVLTSPSPWQLSGREETLGGSVSGTPSPPPAPSQEAGRLMHVPRADAGSNCAVSLAEVRSFRTWVWGSLRFSNGRS